MGTAVKLFVYDLSGGVASIMSSAIMGRHIDGIWHTSIVVFEREYYFGGQGIQACEAGCTVLGEPKEKLSLGETFIPYSVFKDYLQGLSTTTFRGIDYNFLKHNCNTFSNELAQFLCGASIPKYILDLPDTVLETPIGQAILPFIERLGQAQNFSRSREYSPDFVQLTTAIEEVRRNSLVLDQRRNELNEKLAKKEKKRRKKEKREKKERDRSQQIAEKTDRHFRSIPEETGNRNPPKKPQKTKMADTETANGATPEIDDVSQVTKKARDVVAEIEEEEKRELEELRKKQREPPVVFKDALDVRIEFDALVGLIDGKISPEEQQSLEELHQYLLEGEGSWALGDSFLNFIGRLLHDRSLPPEVRVRTLNNLALAALKDDVILLLHQDRREHVLMNYASDVERLSLEEQQALALFFANLFENLSSSEWLLYISEWQYCNTTVSNIRVTTKVAVNALLSDVPVLQDRGSAIIHNMACKEVFDDVAVELTMALLQYLNSNPSEELLFRTLKSLARFCQISGQEVPQLIQMIGPDPNKFKGASTRVDEQIAAISTKLR